MNNQWKIVPSDAILSIADRIKFNCPNAAKELEQIIAASGSAPVPPAGWEVQDSAKMEFDRLAHAHVLAICRGAAASCTEQHSYMQGAKTDSKNWFPHKWVIDAIRNLIGINQSTCLSLRDDTTRLNAEVSALQQRLNIADQRVCDLTTERDGLQSLYDETQARLIASMKEAKVTESQLTKALSWLGHAKPLLHSGGFNLAADDIGNYLSHQSAPAAKGRE